MLQSHRLQSSRFELKYIIPEETVRPLRQFALSYLAHDEHADPLKNYEYEVHSLYLDSPALTLCRATMSSQKNRFKLRIRFYDRSPGSTAYFEIKRRVSDVILKQRAAVRPEAVPRLLAGDGPSLSHLVKPRANEIGALERFCSLRDQLQADGMVFVSYIREAYVSPNDDSVRVTFDRQIFSTPYDGNLSLRLTHEPTFPEVGGMVLELKFTNRFPNWMREMVRAFDLERVSMAKYVACVKCLAPKQALLALRRRELWI